MATNHSKKAAVTHNLSPAPGLAPAQPPGASGTVAAGATTTSATQVAAPMALPPDLTLPVVPTGFVPVDAKDYAGVHPRAAQAAAMPNAITELEKSTSYEATFGATVPPADKLAGDMTTAAAWTAQREALENYLVYVKSCEAVTWKLVLAELDQLNAGFKAAVANNSGVAAQFPATARLLDVPKVLAQRAAATRARKAKGKEKAEPKSASPTAATATSVTPAIAGGTSGGTAH
jgi:hypothetical protein